MKGGDKSTELGIADVPMKKIRNGGTNNENETENNGKFFFDFGYDLYIS